MTSKVSLASSPSSAPRGKGRTKFQSLQSTADAAPLVATLKRKREALRELLCNGVSRGERTLARQMRTAKDENAHPPVFIATPIFDATHRPSSNGRSRIPVLQPERQVHADDNEPTPKRQCMFSGRTEDVAAELDVPAKLDAYIEEAQPGATVDGDVWEEIEEEDFDDPTMASEYITDIQRYLKDIERNTMPNPNYMESQPKLTWEMRAVLNQWLMQVHTRFRLAPETLFLCTNFIDRFLSARAIPPPRLQLVGMACLLIASKFEEIISPAVENFILVCDGAYTVADVINAEQQILRALNWDLSYPGPVNYLHRISKADGYDPRTRTLAKYLIEIACVEHRLMPAPPSLVAAAAMWLARIVLGEEEWTPALAHYAMYPESALIPVATHMLSYVLQPILHEVLYKKYAGKRNMKASVHVRQWALARWAEGTTLDLAADLPAVKDDIREQKRLCALRKAQNR